MKEKRWFLKGRLLGNPFFDFGKGGVDMDLEKWLADWTACVDGIFGERICFLGIQGSYGRGEATAESDIDVVLLLDGLQLEDLQAYDEAVSALPMREKLCGFVGGWEELMHWDKADLFQFIQDTTPLRGSLDDLWNEITKADIQRAVHKGACDLYHGCVHNFLHEKDGEMLKAFYKGALFVVQAVVYLQKGVYGKKRTDLEQLAEGMEKEILSMAKELKGQNEISRELFEQGSRLLLCWTGRLIKEEK